MTPIQTFLTGCVFALLLGLGGGWYAHGKVDQAAQAKVLKAAVDDANKAADARVAQEKKAKEDAEDQLVGAQAATLRLNAWLTDARANVASLQDQLRYASFAAAPRPRPLQPDGKPMDRCPGPAVSSPEFVRLYHAAAQGTAAGGAGQAGRAGGVH